MLKKIIAFLLVSVIMLSCGACTVNTTTSKEPNTNQATQPDSKSGEEPMIIEVFEGINVTLPTPDKDPILQELQKRLGIELIMNTSLPADDYRNQLNVRIAGGDIPDVFWILSRADLLKHSKDGTIMNLTPYIDRLSDVVKFLGEDDMKAGYIGDQMYAIAKAPNIPYPTYFLRKDWLDNLNMELPETLDELIEVTEKFTFNDPDKNGIQDTIGLTAPGSWSAFAAVFGGYAIGLPGNVYVKDGKLVDSLHEPDMKEALQVIKDIVSKGVVDPELFTVTNGEHFREKCFQGKAGIIYDGWPAFSKAMDAIKQVNPEATWVQIASPKGPKGQFDTPHAYFSSGLLSLSANLPEDEPKLNKVLELFNYISAREGNNLVSYGIKGQHYNEENGKIVATSKLASEGGYFWAYQLTGRPELEYLYTKFVGWEKEITFASEVPRLRNLEPFVVVPDNINLSDANRFISEELIKFIYGRRPLNEYDAFLKELDEDFNYNEYIEICNEQLKELGFIK